MAGVFWISRTKTLTLTIEVFVLKLTTTFFLLIKPFDLHGHGLILSLLFINRSFLQI